MLGNFSFVIDGLLAGSALPGSFGDLMEDLKEAKQNGITTVVSLTETPLPQAFMEEARLSYTHIPIDDFTPPSISQVDQFVQIVDEVEEKGGAVLVHCFAGVGRTGTMAAAYLIKKGSSADEAVSTVRQRRPGSIETRSQLQFLNEVEQSVR